MSYNFIFIVLIVIMINYCISYQFINKPITLVKSSISKYNNVINNNYYSSKKLNIPLSTIFSSPSEESESKSTVATTTTDIEATPEKKDKGLVILGQPLNNFQDFLSIFLYAVIAVNTFDIVQYYIKKFLKIE
mmetsp:Transcript_16113/g.14565  ORF Transcript_16113/g.14565 Transcript_16113/m.14565 type:complete len:133 (+) Transcript_16113:80-478(+)